MRTWFQGYKYHGGFRYERIGGGDLTVVNVVDLETYIKGVIPYEMSSDWPLEALKAQAICARSYAYSNVSRTSTAPTTSTCAIPRTARSTGARAPTQPLWPQTARPGGGRDRRGVRPV